MQRPSVYVGVSETSFSKPSPRHAPATGYVVGEIEEVAHDDVRPPLKTSIGGIWGLKPEEAVHLIPLTLVLCGLILSLPTFYNAYQGELMIHYDCTCTEYNLMYLTLSMLIEEMSWSSVNG